MKYHWEANAEIEPKRSVLPELKRIEQYSDIFSKKLKPSFIKNLKKLHAMDKKFDEILDLYRKIDPGEVEYFRIVMRCEIEHGSLTKGKEGIVMNLRQQEKEVVVSDENGEIWRLG